VTMEEIVPTQPTTRQSISDVSALLVPRAHEYFMISSQVFTLDSIYSAYIVSPVRLSLCLSVRWVDHTKTVEVKIMKFSPYSSPIPLIFAGQVSSRNTKGFPERGRQTREEFTLFAIFKREYLENGSRYG